MFYGVEVKDYQAFGVVLVETFKKVLGSDEVRRKIAPVIYILTITLDHYTTARGMVRVVRQSCVDYGSGSGRGQARDQMSSIAPKYVQNNRII
jgi:hypothetical protein